MLLFVKINPTVGASHAALALGFAALLFLLKIRLLIVLLLLLLFLFYPVYLLDGAHKRFLHIS